MPGVLLAFLRLEKPFELGAAAASWALNVPLDRHEYMLRRCQPWLPVFAVLVANVMDKCAGAALIALDSDRFHGLYQ
jgi:hypothetical protein